MDVDDESSSQLSSLTLDKSIAVLETGVETGACKFGIGDVLPLKF